MTYENGQLNIYNVTAKEVDKLNKEIISAYEMAYKQIDVELAKTYATVLMGIPPDDYYNEMLKYKRLQNLQNGIADIMHDTFKLSDRTTIDASELAMSNSYYREIYQSQWFSGLDFVYLNKDLLDYAVTGNLSTWKDIKDTAIAKISDPLKNYSPKTGTLTELLADNNEAALAKIRKAVNSNLIQEKSYKVASKDIAEIIGQASFENGVEKVDGLMYKALRISRTEGGRTLSLGQLQSGQQAEAQGVKMQKQWNATLDMRTRQKHASIDGQRVDFDKSFDVSGDMMPMPRISGSASNVINCRCSSINIIDGIEPSLRRGRNPVKNPETGKYETEVFTFRSFDTWAKEKGLKYNKSGRLVKK